MKKEETQNRTRKKNHDKFVSGKKGPGPEIE